MAYRVRPASSTRHGNGKTAQIPVARSPVPRRVVSEETVVRGGGRYFLSHGTIDMGGLADALAVSRATLYRVTGSRDRLLGEVLWWLGSRQLAEARGARRRTGVDGVIEVTMRYAAAVRRSAPFRQFLADEPETAARVLFAEPGWVHRRFIRAQADIFVDVLGPDTAIHAAPEALAYLYIRIVESAIYAELLAGRQPDLDLTEQALRSLLCGAR
ncbi:QsdR family transcriptional regulator [Solwaraspora sp. WMMD792]|uniref:QsdR family transcriptional regulator n=1 Tax=Solwaraspora sp. WMMD792 TaxID=3016099 RepID=UPI00241719DA|nr:QsdR family transcriptional regulator [Solwaraspora sp. WMMD792]MDG4772263.1 QsdR family transcriptional regulator [Solwaraspora sp. WMMD792]